MDMGLLFIEWSNKCKVPHTRFSMWSLGFKTCSTASSSVTPNINKVTEIGNRAQEFCRAQAGPRSKCEVENMAYECLKTFAFLNRRVYRLANGTNYNYSVQITRNEKCISVGEKCYTKVIKAARLAETNCNANEQKKMQESLKSPWMCDHYTVKSCISTFTTSIVNSIRLSNCDSLTNKKLRKKT
jgi:hypothetical protein